MIQHILFKNPWIDYKIGQVHFWKTLEIYLKYGSLKKRDSRMKVIPQLILEHKFDEELMKNPQWIFNPSFILSLTPLEF